VTAAPQSLDGLPPLRAVIRDAALSADKRLGQNFICDLNLTRRIARSAGPLVGRTIVEVGPGPGGLTRALFLEGAERVVAIERDERFRPALAAIGARYPGRLDVVYGDALAAPWPPAALPVGSAKPVIVANLPYNIATQLLVGWLESEPWPPWYATMLLMFQREVAERIVAAPGGKAYGRLAVIAQWRTRPRLLLHVRREAFVPPPSVASALVAFAPIAEPSPACAVVTLARVTGAAFGQRRKMLRQSLKGLFAAPEAVLAAAGIAPTLRAEQLSAEAYACLAQQAERMAAIPAPPTARLTDRQGRRRRTPRAPGGGHA
jgi:16S rRNA (adenine1518-N6/adenine1519-N6)-dimethyltransferase